jgi:hypothetical protein
VEAIVHHYLRGRCINTPGVYVHEVGGIETHVHLAVSIAPTVLISEFVGQLKGASAHEANHKLGRKVLEWQAGYGVVSFGTRDLPWDPDGDEQGVAAIPRASPVNLAGTLTQFRLPLEAVAVIFGVDTLTDMARTTVNLIGNCLASCVMARWEGEFDDRPVAAESGEPPASANGHGV